MNNKNVASQTETVEILREMDTETNNLWQPFEGNATKTLGDKVSSDRIDAEEWEVIRSEAISILSKCVPPNAPSTQETGLVIGYVQSGKTLSFTTVASLAQDNGYQIVIVITGTSVNLRDQSTKRLEDDLGLHTHPDRKWHHFKSHEFNEDAHFRIRDVLADWQDENVPEWERQTVLITVMKHHQHLEKLIAILLKIRDLEAPTLIIDDEGDQASLNTMIRKGEASPTYQRILSLRECLPHHTFLQYTATPQALLLINLIDVLSPNFVKVLSPGESYQGGKAFFQNGQNHICTIPSDEIPTKDQPLDAPPESLLEAMRIFFLGVSAGIILDRGTDRHYRSMMVHPSYKTIEHRQYYNWICSIRTNWLETLELAEDEMDYQDLLEDFKSSYQRLHISVPDLPPFEELSKRLRHAIRRTQTHEVNATRGKTPSIPWGNAYPHILVGGQAMDRGFTVRGLTVTYMPRGAGLGNADTIQQRARFFGYKKDIFGYCRVFLEDRVRDAYEHYVIHEEDVRQRLTEYDKTGKSLDDWRRTFLLDSSLRPTRANIIDIGYSQRKMGNHWYVPKGPHHSIEVIENNRKIVQEFCQKLSFQEDEGNPERTKAQIHHVNTDVLLQDVYKDLLVPFRVKWFGDSDMFTRVCLQIKEYLTSYPNAPCTIYHMSKGSPRTRSLDDKDEIVRLFQGRNPVKGKAIYPGDRNIKNSNRVTIQIHHLRVTRAEEEIFSDVPVLAVWLPSSVSSDLLDQPQGGTDIGS